MSLLNDEFAQKQGAFPFSLLGLGSWKPQFNLLDGDSVDTMATGFRNLPVPNRNDSKTQGDKDGRYFHASSRTGTIVYVGCAMSTDICLEMHLTAFEKSRLAERRAGHVRWQDPGGLVDCDPDGLGYVSTFCPPLWCRAVADHWQNHVNSRHECVTPGIHVHG